MMRDRFVGRLAKAGLTAVLAAVGAPCVGGPATTDPAWAVAVREVDSTLADEPNADAAGLRATESVDTHWTFGDRRREVAAATFAPAETALRSRDPTFALGQRASPKAKPERAAAAGLCPITTRATRLCGDGDRSQRVAGNWPAHNVQYLTQPPIDARPYVVPLWEEAPQDHIYFQRGSSEIQPQYLGILDRLAAFLTQHPNKRLVVEGHTDEDEVHSDRELARAVSFARGQQVKEYLLDLGVSSRQVKVVPMGFLSPMFINTSEDRKAKNRRVVLKLE